MYTISRGQTDSGYPQIGKPIADYELKQARQGINNRTSDYLGKWLIMDFWHKYCTSCVSSFGPTNDMQKKYSDSVQFILIGREDPENEIKIVYERFRKKLNLEMVSLFDSGLHNQLDIGNCPYIIVVDPKGIVRAITYKISENDLLDFFKGITPVTPRVYRRSEETDYTYDPKMPILVNDNGGETSSFLYRSLLSKWTSDIPPFAPETIEACIESGGGYKFEVLGVSLNELYNYAYFGTSFWMFDDTMYAHYSKKAILEINEKDKFLANFEKGQNMYSYSLISPYRLTKSKVQEILKQELKRIFGYSVKEEKKMMPCWKLTTLSPAGNKYKSLFVPFEGKSIQHSKLYLKNKPVKYILPSIRAYNNDQPDFVDCTGIKRPVYINEDVIMTDFEAIKSALMKYGLQLVKSQTLMNVLIIQDH